MDLTIPSTRLRGSDKIPIVGGRIARVRSDTQDIGTWDVRQKVVLDGSIASFNQGYRNSGVFCNSRSEGSTRSSYSRICSNKLCGCVG